MKNLALIFFLILPFLSLSQNVNLILQVNGKIIMPQFINVYFLINTEEGIKKIHEEYVPGDLKFNEETWTIIKSQPDKKISLQIEYFTYKKGKQEIANFDLDVTKYLIDQKYLIADIYDFRDKSYKHKYQYITDKNYLVQFYYRPENGVHGIYIPMK
ncbi:hypothetical protein EV143_112109 [Flavobacterium chryseum]|uniref:hypothetical protein n=1 Tax=Flavobacterium sp. P3160 TaxID=2512113 RepID=UPI001060B791|nr:hypothetical protein [Flavobacterium sp. P3160]TDO70030.1 hypothetical protein EV143_112109 [Flavobacterium sp. P3160]